MTRFGKVFFSAIIRVETRLTSCCMRSSWVTKFGWKFYSTLYMLIQTSSMRLVWKLSDQNWMRVLFNFHAFGQWRWHCVESAAWELTVKSRSTNIWNSHQLWSKLNMFTLDQSSRESTRVHESQWKARESESLNSHQLSSTFIDSHQLSSSLIESR